MSQATGKPVRILSFIQKNESITDEQFQNYWRDVHGPKALPFMKKHNVLYYSQTYTTPIPSQESEVSPLGSQIGTWEYSAITTIVFPSAQDADAFGKDPEYAAIVREDAAYMTQGGKMTIAFGNEDVLVGKQ